MNRSKYLMVLLGMTTLVLLTQSCDKQEVVVLNVQTRLDAGETPIGIYHNNKSLLDSLYGKTYQGGLIAYLDTVTSTGLIAAPVDQGLAEWGIYCTEIGGTSSAIGTGQTNTTLILDGCAQSKIAARLCDDLVYDGYDDWFLPSLDELNLMWKNLADIDGDGTNKGTSDPNNIGGFINGYYWSSTGFDDILAYLRQFNIGKPALDYKYQKLNVRAVRAF